MKSFIVTSDEAASVVQTIDDHYRDYSFQVTDQVWVIADDNAKTTFDICEKFGFNDKRKQSGAVFDVTNYQGFFNKALWEKLNTWGEL